MDIIEIYNKIIELHEAGRDAVLCTVVSAKGSTPLKEGAKMIIDDDFRTYGTVGGGKVERETIEKAKVLLRSHRNKLIHIDLISDEGNSCGGTVDVFIETVTQNCKLLIFGAGHVGKALVQLVKNLGFDITVIDNRNEIFQDWPDDKIRKVIAPPVEFLKEVSFDDNLFITIITYDHNIDREILTYCAPKEWRYLGMMGSKSKVAGMRKILEEAGVNEEIINKINMPIGMKINAETAGEIAVSIAAQLILEKNALAEDLKKRYKI